MLTYPPRAATPDRRLLNRVAANLTIDHLWVVTVLTLIWIFISVLPLPPNDLWWHMAAGRAMVNEGALITTNRWAYTLPYDAPYVYQSWISEIVLYLVWRIGDVPLLTLTRSLVIVLSYGLVAWHAWRRVGQGRAVALALLVAALIGWNNWTLRPQTLALLPGAVFLVVLGEYLARRIAGRWLALLPLLVLLWVNMHGSFILGPVLLALAWLGTAIGVWRDRRQPDAVQRRQLGELTITGAAAFGALLCNPLGWGIFAYLRLLFTNSSVQTRIAEWQPLAPSFDPVNPGFWFFGMLLALAALLAIGPRRPSTVDLLWYCGLAWLGISAGRHAIWFALFLLPLLAERVALLMSQRLAYSGRSVVNVGYLALLVAAAFTMVPWLQPARYLGPGSTHLYASSGRYRMLIGNTTPVAATAWLATHPIEGRFWTDMTFTSYTTWVMPEKQIFADLRIELFPEAIWDDYFDITRGDERSLRLIDRWQITHLLLGRDDRLHQLLSQTPGWCERYGDPVNVIVARCH